MAPRRGAGEVEQIKAEMKLLNWHKLANDAALKARAGAGAPRRRAPSARVDASPDARRGVPFVGRSTEDQAAQGAGRAAAGRGEGAGASGLDAKSD